MNITTPSPGHFRPLIAGILSYADGLALQQYLLTRRAEETEDVLVLLEHLPVVTLGSNAAPENLLLSASEFDKRGIERVVAPRGGDVTYHGPGQLVGYPIVDLKPLGRDVRGFLRMLEDVLLAVLQAFSITGHRVDGKTGVWVDGEKIASIGIGVRRWVSWHGFALNVSTDLKNFDLINPCGLQGVHMTSMKRILGCGVSMTNVQRQLVQSFADVFQSRYAGEYEFLTTEKA